MISFNDISKLFSFNLENKYCIEIAFSVKVYPKYQYCWMGKMPDDQNKEKELYWYGLTDDGSEGYDYYNFEDFSSAPAFDGKSLKELWDDIEILYINGCDPENMIRSYL